MIREDVEPALTKAKDVHRDGKRLREEERNADAAADLEAQRLGDHREGAASADTNVGCDRRKGEAGEAGDGEGDKDDEPAAEKADTADDPAQP